MCVANLTHISMKCSLVKNRENTASNMGWSFHFVLNTMKGTKAHTGIELLTFITKRRHKLYGKTDMAAGKISEGYLEEVIYRKDDET